MHNNLNKEGYMLKKRAFNKRLLTGSIIAASLAVSPAFSAPQKNKWQMPDPVTDADYPPRNIAKDELGKLLYYDKILSGNKNNSCASCHHALTDTGDGLSLPVGEGAQGLGITRNTGTGENAVHERVPRNAPHVFNLGSYEFTTMFHDGRLQKSDLHPTGYMTPAGDDFLPGLDTPVAAQAMFPVTSPTEMAGQAGENEVANAAVAGNVREVWRLLTKRVTDIPEYRTLLFNAYPELNSDVNHINFAHIANAIGAYEATAFRADNSPFDNYIRGDWSAMSPKAEQGFTVFNTSGQCVSCHSGKFQTDEQFYALGVPQIGPGKGVGLNGHDDFGRELASGDPADRYRFRTPSLRNVAITGPWGHDGAFNTLEAVVRHHMNAVSSLNNYDDQQTVLPSRSDLDAIDFQVHNDSGSRAALANSIEIDPIQLSDQEFTNLMAFLHALTDPASVDLRATVPSKVPSGLPLWD
ncbi:MAG: cytochrome c peroxidase [Methylobacter sp.]|nr:cytochrome c peroxidase [Candidatus Methylobacter titanis]